MIFNRIPRNYKTIDTSIKLLLHFDGEDESVDFIDSSASAHTITANGNAQIDTSVKKFGTGSGAFNGSSAYLTISDSDDFNFGSGDFTIDLWLYLNTSGSYRIMAQQSTSDDDYMINWYIASDNILRLLYSTNGSSWDNASDTNGSIALTVLTMNHIALVRNGSGIQQYVNGILDKTWTIGTASLHNSATELWIGAGQYGGGSSFLNGNIDEIRISKGIARYTADFTPATSEFSKYK
jgi:hypothetical protein